MGNELLIGLIGIAGTIVSGLISWFSARAKYNTEVEHNYLQNLEEGLKTYDAIIEHNREEIKQLIAEKNELKDEINDLRKQMLELTFNICLDLTCKKRIRETRKFEVSDEKIKDRFSETQDTCDRRQESSVKRGDSGN